MFSMKRLLQFSLLGALLASGVAEGDEVIVAGQRLLQDGIPVRVVEGE